MGACGLRPLSVVLGQRVFTAGYCITGEQSSVPVSAACVQLRGAATAAARGVDVRAAGLLPARLLHRNRQVVGRRTRGADAVHHASF